jgi:hypothetical protein
MTGRPFLMKIRAAGVCLFIPGEHVFVGSTGFFVREVQLPVGTPVVVQFCRGEETVSLGGTVYASYRDLGLSVGFEETSGPTIERLNTLLAA